MHDIKDIVASIDLSSGRPENEKERINSQAFESIVNDLFEKISAIKPAFMAAWKSQQQFEESKRQWVMAFYEHNLNSLTLINYGLRALRESPSPFIPSVGEFIDICKPRPSDIGAPSLQDAFTEASELSRPYVKEKNWSHVTVRYAARKVGSHTLVNEPRSKVFGDFKEAYDTAIKLFSEGKIMDHLENESPRPPSPSEIKTNQQIEKFKEIKSRDDAFAMMRGMIGVKK